MTPSTAETPSRKVFWLTGAEEQLRQILLKSSPTRGDDRLEGEARQLGDRLLELFRGANHVVIIRLFAGYRANPKAYILLAEEDSCGEKRRRIVKLAASPGHADGLKAEYENWNECRRRGSRDDLVLMRVELKCGGGTTQGVIYQDAAQFIGGEVCSLEEAFLGAVLSCRPLPTSVERTLVDLFDRLGEVLHQFAGTYDPAREADYDLRVPRLGESSRAWTPEGGHPDADQVCREVNHVLTPADGSYRDPLAWLRFIGRRVPLFEGRERVEREVGGFAPDLLVPRMLLGRAHGDLNGRNVLVGVSRNRARWPAVFDYEHMGRQKLIGWDFVKLETELKVRCYPHLFRKNDPRTYIREVHAFELDLAEVTWSHQRNDTWPAVEDDVTATRAERLKRLLLVLRKLAWQALSMQGERKNEWLAEWYFLQACYGIHAGRFRNMDHHELRGAFVSAGVGMARYLWGIEEKIAKAVHGGTPANEPSAGVLLEAEFPDHTYPLGVARRWLQHRPADALTVLQKLRADFPHVLAIRNDLALAYIRTNQTPAAVEVLKATQTEFVLVDEETYCRWGAIFKKEADAARKKKDPIGAEQKYKDALRYYQLGYEVRRGHYPGANTATLFLLLAELSSEQKKGDAEVWWTQALGRVAEVLARRAHWNADLPEDEGLWHPITAAELSLIERAWDKAWDAYKAILADPKVAEENRNTIVRQAYRILRAWATLGHRPDTSLDAPEKVFGAHPDEKDVGVPP